MVYRLRPCQEVCASIFSANFPQTLGTGLPENEYPVPLGQALLFSSIER
jgi:hypothetical protein